MNLSLSGCLLDQIAWKNCILTLTMTITWTYNIAHSFSLTKYASYKNKRNNMTVF